MKKLFTFMLLALLCCAGNAWGDVTLANIDFSEWSDTTICNSKNNTGETVNGVFFYSKNSTAKPFTITSGVMTWCNNNASTSNYYLAIPVTGVNESLTISVYNGTTATRFKYTVVNNQKTPTAGSNGPSNISVSAAPSVATITSLTDTSCVVYLGRQGSGLTTITKIVITTPEASGEKYAVTYDSNGHGTAPTNGSLSSVTLANISVNGWNNIGWTSNVEYTVGGTTYAIGDVIPCGTEFPLTAATTFTAQWEENSYEDVVTYDLGAWVAPQVITSSVEYKGLTILGVSGKQVDIESANATIDGKAFSKRAKLNGSSSATSRTLSIYVTGPCVIDVYMVSASNSDARSLSVHSGSWDGSLIETLEAGTEASKQTLNYTGEVATLVFGGNGGINIYGINVAAAAYDEDDANLSSIKVNGSALVGFDAANTTYNVELPFGTSEVPEITVKTHSPNANAIVTPATNLNDNTVITVTAEDGTTQKTYTVSFSVSTEKVINLVWAKDKTACDASADQSTVVKSDDAIVSSYIEKITFDNVEGDAADAAESVSLNTGKKEGNTIIIKTKPGFYIKSLGFFGKIQDSKCLISTDGINWSDLNSENTSADASYCGIISDGNSSEFYIKSAGNSGVWIRNMQMELGVIDPFVASVSSVGWASLYLTYDAVIPEDVTVYYASAVNSSAVTLTQVENNLPKNTGVIFKATEGDYTFNMASAAVTAIEGNLFEGVAKATACEANANYVLSGESTADSPIFGEYTGTTLGANKAYLPKSKVPSGASGAASRLTFVIGTDNPIVTGLEAVASEGKAVKFLKDGQLFILKNGKVFNAAGQVVK